MKKVLSILLLLFFAFHHFGYYAVYFAHKTRIAAEWQEKVLDENFPSQKVLQIPRKLHYSIDQSFQPANISFKMDGKSYRGIKQRANKGNLELVYVPDIATIKLELNLRKWVISISSNGGEESGEDKILTNAIVKDFVYSMMYLVFENKPLSSILKQGFLVQFFENQVISINSPPPERSNS